MTPSPDFTQRSAQGLKGPVSGNGIVDFLRPILGNLVGGAAATGVTAIPGVGQSGAAQVAANTQGYTAMDTLMQYLKTPAPSSLGEAVTEGEAQAVTNAIAGRLVKSVFSGIGAIRNAEQPEIFLHKPTTSQAMDAYGHHILATGARFAEDFGAAGTKSEALDRAGAAGFSQALRYVNAINGRMANTNVDPVKLADKIRDELTNGFEPVESVPTKYKSWGPSFKANPDVNIGGQQLQLTKEASDLLNNGSPAFTAIDKVIADPDKLSKVLAVDQLQGGGSNLRKDLQAYQFMRMFNDAVTKRAANSSDPATNVLRLDPDKIKDVWEDSDLKTSLDKLWGTKGRESVTKFINTISQTQTDQSSYLGRRAVWLMSGGMGLSGIMGLLSGNISLPAGAVGLYAGSNVLGRMLTKPGVAEILTKMANGTALDEGKQFTARMITNSLQGAGNVAIIGSDGKKQWGHIEDGKFIENK
jgi:hypothetical protein